MTSVAPLNNPINIKNHLNYEEELKVQRQESGTSTYADERLELSVVVHDLQLDPMTVTTSNGRDRANEFTYYSSPLKMAQPFTAFPPGGPSPQKQSAPRSRPTSHHQSARISVLDDPDELFSLSRKDELSKRSSWILPSLFAAVLILRICGPFILLPNAQLKYSAILAPGKSFYYMLIPIYLTNTVLTTMSFTPVLRGSSLIRNGVSFFLPLVIFTDVLWQWLFAKSARVSNALTVVCMEFIFSILLMINLTQRRKHDLAKIWHADRQFKQRLVDYW